MHSNQQSVEVLCLSVVMATEDPDLGDIPDPVASGQAPITVIDPAELASSQGTHLPLLACSDVCTNRHVTFSCWVTFERVEGVRLSVLELGHRHERSLVNAHLDVFTLTLLLLTFASIL